MKRFCYDSYEKIDELARPLELAKNQGIQTAMAQAKKNLEALRQGFKFASLNESANAYYHGCLELYEKIQELARPTKKSVPEYQKNIKSSRNSCEKLREVFGKYMEIYEKNQIDRRKIMLKQGKITSTADASSAFKLKTIEMESEIENFKKIGENLEKELEKQKKKLENEENWVKKAEEIRVFEVNPCQNFEKNQRLLEELKDCYEEKKKIYTKKCIAVEEIKEQIARNIEKQSELAQKSLISAQIKESELLILQDSEQHLLELDLKSVNLRNSIQDKEEKYTVLKERSETLQMAYEDKLSSCLRLTELISSLTPAPQPPKNPIFPVSKLKQKYAERKSRLLSKLTASKSIHASSKILEACKKKISDQVLLSFSLKMYKK